MSGHASSMQTLRNASLATEQELERERTKVKQLEGEVSGLEVVREGMERDLEKCRSFSRKLARVVQLEKGTAEILTSTSDFAHDAILMKAEQLAKLEVSADTNIFVRLITYSLCMQNEALVNKQTAVYSLQRKLKTCKQSILSKELHMSLLQKKVESLEQSSKTNAHMQKDIEEASKKVHSWCQHVISSVRDGCTDEEDGETDSAIAGEGERAARIGDSAGVCQH